MATITLQNIPADLHRELKNRAEGLSSRLLAATTNRAQMPLSQIRSETTRDSKSCI